MQCLKRSESVLTSHTSSIEHLKVNQLTLTGQLSTFELAVIFLHLLLISPHKLVYILNAGLFSLNMIG